jgi:hypothetical protein
MQAPVTDSNDVLFMLSIWFWDQNQSRVKGARGSEQPFYIRSSDSYVIDMLTISTMDADLAGLSEYVILLIS